jgi:hypothetical protein
MVQLHQRKEKGMTVPELQHPHARRIAWAQWAFATATGSTLGAVLGGALIKAWLQPSFGVVTSPLEVAVVYAAVHIPSAAVALGVWGAGIGIMQALMLRRQLVGADWWPLATMSGWAFAGALVGALPFGGAVTGSGIDIGLLGFVADAVVAVLAIGFLSGFFQWLILRQQVDRSVRWVWTTAGGITLAMLAAAVIVILVLVSAVGWLRPEDIPSAASWGVAGAVVGLVYGAVSGQVVTRVLRPSTSEGV